MYHCGSLLVSMIFFTMTLAKRWCTVALRPCYNRYLARQSSVQIFYKWSCKYILIYDPALRFILVTDIS
jgi:hypothetical protein